MKKILFLLLITVSSYGQTYQNPTFGTVTTKTAPTSTTDPFVGTLSSTGVNGKVAPENIPITITPSPSYYTPVTPTIKGHLQGLDNAIGDIPLTTAGVTTRVWFTGDATTIGAGMFYLTNATNKGTVANVSQSVINDDDQKKYFTQDLVGNAFATTTIFPPGVYAGNLSGSTTPNSAQQRFTVELYRCDTNGTPIASGVAGAPVGDLGVTVIIILDSGLMTLADGSVTNISVSANLATSLTVNVGERIRYHVSAAKVGTNASNITESVWYGSSFNSYLDVPTPITSSGVSNLSTVTGATVTTALDNLNTGKENTSNKQNSLITDGAGVKFPTVDAISGGTSYKRTIAQIRALSGTLPNTNFYTTDLGQEGNWYYDSTDLTSSDNTGTVLVTSDGKRIKRVLQGIVNIKWFGAKGDASTNDTSAIQSAINFAGLTGGTVFFPSGDYFTSGDIQINTRVNILGDGEMLKITSNPLPSVVSKGSTSIFTNSNANSLFVVNVDGVNFRNITLYSTATTPTGAGILFNKGNTTLIQNVGVFGFDTNINMVNGASWSMTNSFLYNPVSYNLSINHALLPDGGDQSISNCDFFAGTRAGITHILYKGGGGLKINSCKFNYTGASSVYAKECLKLTNDVGTTADLLVTNCSFENYTDRAINLSPVNNFTNVVIDGNQFYGGSPTPSTDAILINSANINSVMISNNIITDAVNGVNYVNGVNVSVDGNLFRSVTNNYVNSLPFYDFNIPSKLIVGHKSSEVVNIATESSNSLGSFMRFTKTSGTARSFDLGAFGPTNSQGDNGWGLFDNTLGSYVYSVNSSGIFKINNLSGTGTRTVVADSSGNLSATSPQPLVYIGTLNINNTTVSLTTVFNQLGGGTPTISSTGAGTANITFPSGAPMTIAKTLVTMGSYGNTEGGHFHNTTNQLGVVARVGITPTTNTYIATIKIEVYP